jgi:Amt family ammonium transporter
MKSSISKFAAASGAMFLSTAALADNGVSGEVGYLMNTLLLLVCGVLVMFMAAGFAMLEAGMVRSKSVAVILAKNIALYAIASIMFFLLGYELMYGNSFVGLFGEFSIWGASEVPGAPIDVSTGQPSSAGWFFQMVFVATAASVVSGALAERVKFWSFAIFVVALTGILYPVIGHWTWGGGWLAELGFSDFAGSTIVHSVGGWAALAGIMLLGPRRGRFDDDGRAQTLAPSSLPIVTLGTFILWLGWFGFNGGSQLAFSTPEDALAVATIFANTNAGAAGGAIAVMIVSQLFYRRIDLTLILNGALAGLVSITAEPLAPTLGEAALIGAIGGILMIIGTRTLEQLLLDDVVGAIPVHLVAGIWGTVAVCITNPDASLSVQLTGIAAIGAVVFTVSYALWYIMRRTIGIRLKRHHESAGGDMVEVGMRAYNIV